MPPAYSAPRAAPVVGATHATVGTFKNPVVLSNLGIADFHAATLFVIYRAICNPFAGR